MKSGQKADIKFRLWKAKFLKRSTPAQSNQVLGVITIGEML